MSKYSLQIPQLFEHFRDMKIYFDCIFLNSAELNDESYIEIGKKRSASWTFYATLGINTIALSFYCREFRFYHK